MIVGFTGIQVIIVHSVACSEETEHDVGHRLFRCCLAASDKAKQETLNDGIEAKTLLPCIGLRLLVDVVVDGYLHNKYVFELNSAAKLQFFL